MAKPESAFAFALALCRIALFAAILCRKFATAAVFSWHLRREHRVTEMPKA
jgi:hypothetical protein